VVLHDVSNKWTRRSLSPKILRLLHLYSDKESVLVLNKIDLLKEKRLLLELTNKLSEGIIGGHSVASCSDPHPKRNSGQKDDISTVNKSNVQLSEHTHLQNLSEKEVAKRIEGKFGWPHFSRVFMISAIDGDGVSDVVVR
jgi:GTPase Era involved in 16S rRNA processing